MLFLYKRVLETDPGWFDGLTRVQRKKSLPVPYFHLVFTLPHEINPLAQGNPWAA